ncbi:PIG-L family deacetylase [Actinomadura chokoriensis]|uniref:PIG-L family deacetylase n=1 Tax=Actinomadura chokoriensis TaxID=454156 RepID=A0ABV4R5F1_9ACTN
MPTEPRPRAAMVVAHPDDEVIFFGGLAARLVGEGWDVDVVCVTGRFCSPYTTCARRAEFFRACGALGVKARLLDLTDDSGPLDEVMLGRALTERVRWDRYARVYTHGPWGEYGHLHHVQVCRAVHRRGRAVRCLAGPFAPDFAVPLSQAELDSKRRLAALAYPSQPFAARWCTEREDLVGLHLDAVEVLTAIASAERTGDDTALRDASGLRAVALPVLVPAALDAVTPTFPSVTHIPAHLWRDGHRARVRALQRRTADEGGDLADLGGRT